MLDAAEYRIPSMRHRVSPEEWQARVDLAACYRLVDLYGMTDLIANHISVRVPGEHDAFLINAYGMLYEEITASSLLKIDHEGNILAKPDFGSLDYGVNRAGFVIHSAIHMAQARRGLRHAHPHLGGHGGLDHGMRPAAQHPDLDALRQDQLPRLRRRRDRHRCARGAGRETWATTTP